MGLCWVLRWETTRTDSLQGVLFLTLLVVEVLARTHGCVKRMHSREGERILSWYSSALILFQVCLWQIAAMWLKKWLKILVRSRKWSP